MAKKNGLWNEFKSFAIKGNAMNLAVGVIIGGAFSTITTSLTNDMIMPIVSMFLGGISTGIAGVAGIVVDVIIFLVLCGVVSFLCMTIPHAICARLRVEQVFKFYWTIVAGLAAFSLILVWVGL